MILSLLKRAHCISDLGAIVIPYILIFQVLAPWIQLAHLWHRNGSTTNHIQHRNVYFEKYYDHISARIIFSYPTPSQKLLLFFFFSFPLITGHYSIAQAGLELQILPLHSPEYWHCRQTPGSQAPVLECSWSGRDTALPGAQQHVWKSILYNAQLSLYIMAIHLPLKTHVLALSSEIVLKWNHCNFPMIFVGSWC